MESLASHGEVYGLGVRRLDQLLVHGAAAGTPLLALLAYQIPDQI